MFHQDADSVYVTVTVGASDVTCGKVPANAGVAFNAQLMVVDFGSDEGALSSVWMDTEAFPPSYDAGSRIHTNSWGSFTGDSSYTYTSSTVDEYVYDHDDLVVLFAAGNEGEYGWYSVGSPATAKNVITVGATQSSAGELRVVARSCA